MSLPNRLWQLSAAFILVMMTVTAIQMANAPPAQAQLPIQQLIPCGAIPDGVAQDVCDAVKNPVKTVGGAVGVDVPSLPGIPTPGDLVDKVAGGAGNALVAPILNGIAQAEASAVSAVLKEEVKYVNSSTTPALTAKWFITQYEVVFGMAVVLAIMMFAVRMGSAVKDGNPVEIGNSIIAFLTFFFIGTLLPGVVGLLVWIADSKVAPGFMQIAGESASHTMKDMEVNFQKNIATGFYGPILLPLIFLLFGLIGGIITELMLLFREGMLYVVTAGAVLASALYAGGRWGVDTFSRTLMALLALILFKVAMSFILVVGLQLFGSSGAKAVLLGSVMLLMTPILSWMFYQRVAGHTIRFIPGGMGYLQNAVSKFR